MSITIPLTPAEEARLRAKAHAEGTTPEGLVRRAISPILASAPDGAPALARGMLTPDEADRALDEILQILPPMPSLSNQALSRESIYAPEDDSR